MFKSLVKPARSISRSTQYSELRTSFLLNHPITKNRLATTMSSAPISHGTADELAVKYQDRIRGKIIAITGASPNSIGAAFVHAVARASPATVILAGPSVTRLNATIEQAKTLAGPSTTASTTFHAIELDLGSQASVRTAAASINALVPHIDTLNLNAGIMFVPWGLTTDGIEQHFGVNHVGHFLLANLLVDKVLAAAERATDPTATRIVVTSSDAMRFGPVRFDELPRLGGSADGKTAPEGYSKMGAYGNSKSANALHALSLARKLEGRNVKAFSLQPGIVSTGKVEGGNIVSGIGRHMTKEELASVNVTVTEDGWSIDPSRGSMKTPAQGAATSVYAAFDPEVAKFSGKFLRDCAVPEQVPAYIEDEEAADRLWKISEELVGEKFDI